MAGYYHYSMSNNAIEAYGNGEKPLSKWTKTDIIEAIESSGIELQCSMEKLRKLPVKILKEQCLYNSSWHHTSKHFNETNFYTLDEDRLSSITDSEIDQMLDKHKADKNINARPTEEKWKCAFLEWSGSRKHPKATEIIEEGVIKGDWFYRKNGSKKKTTANGFRFIEKIEQLDERVKTMTNLQEEIESAATQICEPKETKQELSQEERIEIAARTVMEQEQMTEEVMEIETFEMQM